MPSASVVVRQDAPVLVLASTVTPGSTAPEVSLTTPSMEPRCSWAATGQANSSDRHQCG